MIKYQDWLCCESNTTKFVYWTSLLASSTKDHDFKWASGKADWRKEIYTALATSSDIILDTSGASGLLHYVVVGHRAGNHMILIVIMNLVLVHEHWNDMLGAHKQTPIAK